MSSPKPLQEPSAATLDGQRAMDRKTLVREFLYADERLAQHTRMTKSAKGDRLGYIGTLDKARIEYLNVVKKLGGLPTEQDLDDLLAGETYVVRPKGAPEDIEYLTRDQSTAQRYLDEGHTVQQATDMDLGILLVLHPMMYQKMDDATWQVASDCLRSTHYRRYRHEPEAYQPGVARLDSVAPDLPSSIAAARLSILAQHPSEQRTKALHDLIEVLRVSEGKPALPDSLMNHPDPNVPSWLHLRQAPMWVLKHSLVALKAERDGSSSNPESFDYQSVAQTVNEHELMIDCHPDNQPEPDDGPSM